MANDEARNNDEVRITDCHPERSEAKSKDPAELLFVFATGLKAWPRGFRPLRCSLDFARNADQIIRHSIIRTSFDIRHSCFVIFSAPANPRGSCLEFLGENARAVEKHRHSRRLDACADR